MLMVVRLALLVMAVSAAYASPLLSSLTMDFAEEGSTTWAPAIVSGVVQPRFSPATAVQNTSLVAPPAWAALFRWSWGGNGAAPLYSLVNQHIDLWSPHATFPVAPAANLFKLSLPLNGTLPVSPGWDEFNVSLTCTASWVAVLTWTFELRNASSPASALPETLQLTFRWQCIQPGCSSRCPAHGTCHNREAYCECIPPWTGGSCDFVMAPLPLRSGGLFCPGDEISFEYAFGWKPRGDEYYEVYREQGRSIISVGWRPFPLPPGQGVNESTYFGSLLQPGVFNVVVYDSGTTLVDSGTVYVTVQDWSVCGVNATCTAGAGTCSGFGTCTGGHCACQAGHWWANCAHGCSASTTTTLRNGVLSSDDGQTDATWKAGYLTDTTCQWLIDPAAGEPWDSLQVVADIVDLAEGDTLTFYEAVGTAPGKSLMSVTAGSGPSSFIVAAQRVIVIFASDYATAGRGFRFHYETISTNRLFKIDLQKHFGELDAEINGFLFTDLLQETDMDFRRRSELEDIRSVSATPNAAYREVSVTPLPDIGEWSFDLTQLGAPLFSVGANLATLRKLPETLKVKRDALFDFIQEVEAGYLGNPYHNSRHAADVAQSINVLAAHSPILLSDMEIAAAIMAAFCHDYRHPGVNNAYMQNTQDALALRYNGISILENMHASESMQLIMKRELLKDLPRDAFLEFQKLFCTLILTTDMAKHVEICGQVGARLASGAVSAENKADRLMVLQLIIKFSDLSNASRPWATYRWWSNNVIEEFFMQGDKERAAGLPISAFMDRNNTDIIKCQIAFIEFVVKPLGDILVKLMPGVEPFVMQNILANLNTWKDMKRENPALTKPI